MSLEQLGAAGLRYSSAAAEGEPAKCRAQCKLSDLHEEVPHEKVPS